MLLIILEEMEPLVSIDNGWKKQTCREVEVLSSSRGLEELKVRVGRCHLNVPIWSSKGNADQQ